MKERSKPSTSIYTSESDLQTIQIAALIGKDLRPGDIVLLEGDLGAGKTTFVKGLAKGRGFDVDEVHSPTFNYLNLYGEIAHFDLYRIETLQQFMAMGFDEYLEKPYIACIEWPEILAPLQLERAIKVVLKHDKGMRSIGVMSEAD